MDKKSPQSSLFRAVYVPTYTKSDEELVRGQLGPRTMEDIRREVEEEIKAKGISTLLDGSFIRPGTYHEPRPLSIEEGKAFIKDKERLLQDIKRIRNKITSLEGSIDQRIGSGSPTSFTFSFKKRPSLRKALKVITGKAKNSITYEDYKKALAVKESLEKEDASAFFEKTLD